MAAWVKDQQGVVARLEAAASELLFPTDAYQGIAIDHGAGSHFVDHDGREYIDFGAGLACLPFGYGFTPVIEAVQRQAAKLLHSGSEVINEESLALAAALMRTLPGYKCFFSNSGAEANEAALKLARRFSALQYGPNKTGIVAMRQSFHGRTLFTVSASGNEAHIAGYAPLVPHVTQIDFNHVDELRSCVSHDTCAVILEVVQGRGGGNELSAKFVEALRQAREKFDCLIIVDDIQTGIGRLGTLFGFERFGLDPDIVTLAKGLAGGLPIGATLARKAIADVMTPGTHGNTFGGNPLAMAAALEVLHQVDHDHFLRDVERRSQAMRQGLLAISDRYGCFGPPQGRGLMLSVALTDGFAGKAESVKRECAKRGLLVRIAGQHLLRFTPALNISHEDLATGLARLSAALLSVSDDRLAR